MADRELVEALHEQAESMDRLAKANWLMYMATQKQMENRTPSNTVFGSYGFGGVNAAWRQILPRNDRRAKVTFMAENLSFYFAVNENETDINTLINWQNVQFHGQIPVALLTFSGGEPVSMCTTGAIWVASLTGGGSNVELAGVLNWVEEVYSSVDAIPHEMRDTNPMAAGRIQRLTAKDMQLDGDVTGTFTREGVR